ncbi:cysteine/Histidine-rich C1 domain family protein [Striga asiatica]|uniref:Cysteine/Histidine-rich C1 domain family protein n=1 Tax=Striga asiatica TaxID=4170 RepID=A0A5A7Q1B1_STRAF|nr:cysteine/Histidine-rich C1 domain family protein [Striga asiatica]
MDWRKWHYGCEECGQYFHANCIPCLDRLSKIKFGLEVLVECHDCPVACVRTVSVDGYLCGHCGKSIRETDDIAFECSKCYFRMHQGCVQELMIKNLIIVITSFSSELNTKRAHSKSEIDITNRGKYNKCYRQ